MASPKKARAQAGDVIVAAHHVEQVRKLMRDGCSVDEQKRHDAGQALIGYLSSTFGVDLDAECEKAKKEAATADGLARFMKRQRDMVDDFHGGLANAFAGTGTRVDVEGR